jgi:hypothetical protein
MSDNRSLLKLNLGCGHNRKDGWVNVDRMPDCNPDIVHDLERFPWPFDDDSVGEIMLTHALEHLGESSETYLCIIRELYRVCAHEATIYIDVPHPRHDHYLYDPTHVRPITVGGLQVFDQALNRKLTSEGYANTPLGIYLGVDFRIKNFRYTIDSYYEDKMKRGEIQLEEIIEMTRTHNNVCQEIHIEWVVVKGQHS